MTGMAPTGKADQGKSRGRKREVYSAHTQSEALPEHPCGDIKEIVGDSSLEFKVTAEDWRSECEVTCVFKARRPTEHSEEKWGECWAQGQSNLQGQEKKVKEPWDLGNVVMGRRKTRSMLLPFLAKIISNRFYINYIVTPNVIQGKF